MGNKFEIQVWKKIEWLENEYGYELFWCGDSWLVAVLNMIKARCEGHGCVTLHWR